MRNQKGTKIRRGGVFLHKNGSRKKAAITGILAALVLFVCAGIAVIAPATAANSTTNTGGFSMANVISSVKMFYGAGELVGQNGTAYNGNVTDVDGAVIDEDGDPGYLSTKVVFAVYSAKDNSLTFYNRAKYGVNEGDTFNGKVATAIYTGFDTANGYDAGASPWYEYADVIKTVTVADKGISPVSMKYWFRNLTAVTSMDLTKLDTSDVTSLQGTFQGCTSLKNITGINTWDTSKITAMPNTFKNCSALATLDLAGWDTSNVVNMMQTFNGCSSLTSIDLSTFDTSSVGNMQQMFLDCSSLKSLDVSGFDTSNVINMYQMFLDCSSLKSLDVSGFDTSNVEILSAMFGGCSSLQSINVTGFDFSGLTDDLTTTTIAASTGRSLYWMFYNCSALTTITGLNTWDTSNVTQMHYMFYGCSSLTSLNLSSFDTSNVTQMQYMFYSCSSLKTIYASSSLWSTASVEEGGYMFRGCTNIKGGNGTTYDSDHVGYTYACIDKSGQKGYLTAN